MMDDLTTAASASLQHGAVMASQTDTGYQSNIMQTTGSLSTTTTATTCGMQFIQQQHSAVGNVDSFDQTDDL